MYRFFFLLALGAGACLIFSAGSAFAATPSKGLKIEPMLQQAIMDTAVPEPEEEFTEEYYIEEEPVDPQAVWGPPVPPEPSKPIFPVYIEEKKEDTRPKFSWPEKPGQTFNGLLFLPSLFVKTGWTDNLYVQDKNTESDLVTSIMPRLRIEIPDIRHDIALEGSYEYRRHWDHADENQHNVTARLEGALNAANSIMVPFDLAYENLNEEREDDLLQERSAFPLSQENFRGKAGIQFKPNSFSIALLGHYKTFRNEDGRQRVTNVPIIRRDGDHDVMALEFHTSFDLDPQNTLMLWGTYGEHQYERRAYQNGAFNGPRRDSDDFAGHLSWMFDYPGLRGHISVGLDNRNFVDLTMTDVRELVGDMEIDHQINDITSVNFQLGRSVYDDVAVVEPIIKSRASLYFDRQLWDEILLAMGTDYTFYEFKDSGRDDELWNFRVIADYFINDFLSFGAEYGYTTRGSEQNGLDFDRNRFMLRARGRL